MAAGSALKFLHEAFSATSGSDAVAAFEREARVIARLQHPNIVGVFDAGTHEGRRFIAMEYVNGYTLRDLLETQGRMTEAEAIRYGAQVAAALQYAHEQGVVHCDIKPENIIINETGVAKVADFGVAETINRTLAPGQAQDLLGTIAYLAPELIQGSQPDARTDVYALGLTVYEMVAGRLPFTGASAAAIAGQRLARPAPLLRTYARGASAELEGVLARAMALSPEDRFPSAAAFGAALRRVPLTQARPAPVVAPPGRPPQLQRRQPTARVRRGAVRQDSGGVSGATLLVVIGIILIAIGLALPPPFSWRTRMTAVAPNRPQLPRCRRPNRPRQFLRVNLNPPRHRRSAPRPRRGPARRRLRPLLRPSRSPPGRRWR